MRSWGEGFSGEKCPKHAYLRLSGPVGGGPVETTPHRPVGGGPVEATPHRLYQCLIILRFISVANYYLPPKCTSVALSSSTFPGVSKHAIGNSREDPSQKTPNGRGRCNMESCLFVFSALPSPPSSCLAPTKNYTENLHRKLYKL